VIFRSWMGDKSTLTLELRAERAGQRSGRVYTIMVRCIDASGNATKRAVKMVPRNHVK
jgi:hypothetical protein